MSDLFNWAAKELDPSKLAAKERDAGMARALKRAKKKDPDFEDKAVAWIRQYAQSHLEFIAEECRVAAAETGFVADGAGQSWGHAFKRAAREGVIRKLGYGQSIRRHLSPTVLWGSLQP